MGTWSVCAASSPIPKPWRWGSAASTSTTTTRRATSQFRALREQWELAIELGLPVVVHNRDSNEEMLGVVREEAFRDLQPISTPSLAAGPWPRS